ncbi:MAG: type II toxin-antitoxin system VapB family antitoxin [Methylovulum sp.]|nr:type II toxin-antitoxin system VapB family antitoxin [Methylovulum sp.]
MTTNLAIDDDLINEALTLGHFKTKEDTVVTALKEFINRRKDESEQIHLSDLVTEKVKMRNKQYNQDEILAAIDEAVSSR